LVGWLVGWLVEVAYLPSWFSGKLAPLRKAEP